MWSFSVCAQYVVSMSVCGQYVGSMWAICTRHQTRHFWTYHFLCVRTSSLRNGTMYFNPLSRHSSPTVMWHFTAGNFLVVAVWSTRTQVFWHRGDSVCVSSPHHVAQPEMLVSVCVCSSCWSLCSNLTRGRAVVCLRFILVQRREQAIKIRAEIRVTPEPFVGTFGPPQPPIDKTVQSFQNSTPIELKFISNRNFWLSKHTITNAIYEWWNVAGNFLCKAERRGPSVRDDRAQTVAGVQCLDRFQSSFNPAESVGYVSRCAWRTGTHVGDVFITMSGLQDSWQNEAGKCQVAKCNMESDVGWTVVVCDRDQPCSSG